MKTQKGITLIALIITIIVMLILVGVSVTVALNGGLFKTAQDAAQGTKLEGEKERLLSIVLGTLNDKGIVDTVKLKAALNETEFTYNDEDGTITSGKTQKTYEVSQRGSVTEQTEPQGTQITWTKTGDLAIGTPVETSTGEKFYVIGFTGTNDDTVELLAKYNLKADENGGYIQDDTGAKNPCTFCSSDDWVDNTNSGDNLNVIYASVEDSAVGKAVTYGESLGGVTGRLLLKSEVLELQTANSTIVKGQYEEGKEGLNYWLGTKGEAPTSVQFVLNTTSGTLFDSYNSTTYECGVRPVVEVLVSAIQ